MSLSGAVRHDAFRAAHSEFQDRFDPWLGRYLQRLRDESASVDLDLASLYDCLNSFALRSGKRIRPFLVWWGYRAAGGAGEELVLPAAGAAELLHVFALAHDDVMDQSDLRRGQPTVHRIWEKQHRANGWRGEAGQFGTSMAILTGDMALALSDSLMDSSSLPPETLIEVRRVWNTMRQEVVQGQFLDVLASSRQTPASEEQIWSILSLKSGKYTLERPLHLGASAAGADQDLLRLLTGYGVPLGRAFQIQDDILGLFGAPDLLGKPVDSDIKEGKSTLLISRAFREATPEQRETLYRVLGSPEASATDVQRVREIVTQTGALDHARRCAQDLVSEARAALASPVIPDEPRDVLLGLADFLLDRQA